jgi:hypothetical protein
MSYENKYKKKVNNRVKVVRNIGDGEVLKAILSREDKDIELGFSRINKFKFQGGYLNISKEKFSTLSSELGFDISFLGRRDTFETTVEAFDTIMLSKQDRILGVYVQEYDSRTNNQMKQYLVNKKIRKDKLRHEKQKELREIKYGRTIEGKKQGQ